jgi:hypothetical protein
LDGEVKKTRVFPHHTLVEESTQSRWMGLVRQEPTKLVVVVRTEPERNKSGQLSGFEACFGLGDNVRCVERR